MTGGSRGLATVKGRRARTRVDLSESILDCYA